MADKDKKLSVVYTELLTAVDTAKADVSTKKTAFYTAREEYSAAQLHLDAQKKKQEELLAMYPELAE